MRIKTLFLFALSVLALSCKDDKEIDNEGIRPVEPSETVKKFFSKSLPSYSTSGNESIFNFSKIEYGDSECFVVNSDEDFKSIVDPKIQLPSIDFNQNTLIVGQHCMPNSGFVLYSQSINDITDTLQLVLTYKSLDGGSADQVATYYFWGLYNKLPEKKVVLRIKRI